MLKTSSQEIKLALGAKIQSFIRLTRRRPKLWNKINKKSPSADKEDCRVVKLLAGAREVVASMLWSSTRLAVMKQIAMPSYNKWYLVSNKSHKKSLPCNKEQLLKLEFRCP
ncbi:hypothetical protein ZWY2020_029034 [Hordeum vulgare]|nr:hypothetical protein ZWY2020_029034 [Hordeum vulgare]